LRTSVRKIVSWCVADVLDEIQHTTPHRWTPSDGDVLTFYFTTLTDPAAASGPPPPPDPLGVFPTDRIALGGITYFAANGSGTTEFLKVGYFSNMRWNPRFRDEASLKILQNYNRLLQQQQLYQGRERTFPMYEFLAEEFPQNVRRDEQNQNLFSFPETAPQNGDNNVMLREAIRLGLIDVNDKEELAQGLKGLTTAELTLLQQSIEKNPELAEKIYEEEKRKKLETGIDVANTISRALQEGPLALYAKNSAVDRVLSQFGIKALAKEAMICLTFGINFEIARITAALSQGLQEELNERPMMDLSQFEMFKIKGDIWKEILNIVLDSVMQAVIGVILQLARLLKEVCNINNPRATDYGATNLADLAGNNVSPPNEHVPSLPRILS